MSTWQIILTFFSCTRMIWIHMFLFVTILVIGIDFLVQTGFTVYRLGTEYLFIHSYEILAKVLVLFLLEFFIAKKMGKKLGDSIR